MLPGGDVRIEDAAATGVSALISARSAAGWQVLAAGRGRVRLWRAGSAPATGVECRTDRQWETLESVAFVQPRRGAGLVIAMNLSRGLWRWDATTGEPIGPPAGDRHLRLLFPTSPALVAVDGEDGPVIVGGLRDGSLCRIDAASGQQLVSAQSAHVGVVSALATVIAPDGTPLVVSGGADGLIRRWEARTGRAWGRAIERCGVAVASASVGLADGRVVVCVGSARGRIHRIDIETGERIGETIRTGWEPSKWRPICRPLVACGSSVTGEWVATSVDNRDVQIWDLRTGAPVGAPIKFDTWLTSLAAAAGLDGRPLLLAADDAGNVWQLDPATGMPTDMPVRPHGRDAQRVLAVPTRDGAVLAVEADNSVRFFDVGSGAPLRDRHRPWRVWANAFAVTDVNGRPMLIAATEQGIERVDLASGDPIEPHEDESPSTIWDVAAARLDNGQVVIAGAGHDWDVYRWDAATGHAIGEHLKGHPISVKAVTIAAGADGEPMIISGCEAGQIRRWDARTGEPIGAPLPGDVGSIGELTVVDLGDGKQMLVCIDFEGAINRWDPITGELLGPAVAVANLAGPVASHVGADGVPTIFVVTSDEDDHEKRIERWRLDTASPVEVMPPGFRGAFNDRGMARMVLASEDGSLLVTALPPATT